MRLCTINAKISEALTRVAIKKVIGKLGLNKVADDLRMRYFQIRNLQNNNAFSRSHPTFALPPDIIMYETFRLDYEKYYSSGLETSRWIIDLFQSHSNRIPHSILDWGCGPARVVRHMPDLLAPDATIKGSDFNASTIGWCRQHIHRVEFLTNELDPPIKLEIDSLECIYAISVFTHLSLARHHSWIQEILRLLSSGGIFIFTTQGDIFRGLLQKEEQRDYDSGKLVTRDHRMEGRRIFSAFHPFIYVQNLLTGFEILEHQVGGLKDNNPQQDLWIVKKK